MMLLSKADVFGVEDLKREVVPVPEWGGDVLVRGATAEEADAYQDSLSRTKMDEDGKTRIEEHYENAKARFIVNCIINEDGTRMFTPAEVEKLGKKSAVAINRIYQVAARLSGTTKRARQELEGNSGAGQAENSSSTLPAT